jgi:hypothetical protein
MAFSGEGSFSCHTYCDTGPRFIRSYPKDRYPSPTVGLEPGTQGSPDLCASALTTAPRHAGGFHKQVKLESSFDIFHRNCISNVIATVDEPVVAMKSSGEPYDRVMQDIGDLDVLI